MAYALALYPGANNAISLFFYISNQFVYNIHKPDDLVEKAGWIPGHIEDAQKFADDGRTKVKASQMWSNR